MAHLPGPQAQRGIWPQGNNSKRETTTNPWILEEDNLSSAHPPTLFFYQENITANIFCTRHQTLVTRKKGDCFGSAEKDFSAASNCKKRSQELPGCCGHTRVPQCLDTEPVSIHEDFSVPHCGSLQTGTLGCESQRHWGHLQAPGCQSSCGAAGWGPLSRPHLACPVLSSAECRARWISWVLESSIRRVGIKPPCFLSLCKSVLPIRYSELPITSAICLLGNSIQRNLTFF